MKKGMYPIRIYAAVLIAAICLAGTEPLTVIASEEQGFFGQIADAAGRLFGGEPQEVRTLRNQAVLSEDPEGYQEYYFSLLNDSEQRCYREILDGIRRRDEEFYLSTADDAIIDKVYRAVLKDHPEIFWAHNRENVYKTTYRGADYCSFSPGYTYTDEEVMTIQNAMESCYQEFLAQIPEGADDYEKAKTAYTYLIDLTDYQATEHDQNIAGVFWQRQAVCAGYAGAFQYLMERVDIPCIYVDGDAAGSTEGHAWNIITLDGQYYYVDVTNGDQPEFLEGDALELAEHKTTLMDYLCPFPWEYEAIYTPSEEFVVPACTATDKNFYVLNQGCFDAYDWQTVYDYCLMRLNNGAADVRFKFSNAEAYQQAYAAWVEGDSAQEVARYYLGLYGLDTVEYHYGVLPDLMTIYYMF